MFQPDALRGSTLGAISSVLALQDDCSFFTVRLAGYCFQPLKRTISNSERVVFLEQWLVVYPYQAYLQYFYYFIGTALVESVLWGTHEVDLVYSVLFQSGLSTHRYTLFHRNRFGQIPGLVYVSTFYQRHMVAK